MKTTAIAIVIALLGTAISVIAQPHYVTLTHNKNLGAQNPTNQTTLIIGSNEIAEVVTLFPNDAGCILEITKGSVTNLLISQIFNQITGAIIVAGPAAFRVDSSWSSLYGYVYATIKIVPESLPPDKTIILPEGTVGTIHVESSTNLVQWQDKWVQIFANTNHHRFFRLRAERTLP